MAICMDANSHAKSWAGSAETILEQVQKILRGRRETRLGLRVGLRTILKGIQAANVSSDEMITSQFLIEKVPNIPEAQANRILEHLSNTEKHAAPKAASTLEQRI